RSLSCPLLRMHGVSDFLAWIRPPPVSTLFPYTTLFRSSPWRRRSRRWPPGRNTRSSGDARQGASAPPRPRGQYDLGRPRVCCATDRKSTRLNSSHVKISYAVFCVKKKRRRGLLLVRHHV